MLCTRTCLGFEPSSEKKPMDRHEHQPAVQRRRQQRLHLSCVECRRRKVRCDRAKPCFPCIKADRGQLCHYETPPASSGRSVPGQLVFAARPAQPLPHHHQQQQQNGKLAQRSLSSTPAAESNRAQRPEPASGDISGQSGRPSDAIPLLRQFWHGSKAGDQYVSPFDRRAIVLPKEVVIGENDATVFWGRSHEANFVPRITDMTTLLLKSAEDNDISTLLEVEHHTRPTVRAPSGMDPELLALVPPRPMADRLWRTYIENFESYYRILHVPTFEREYQHFWATQQGPRYFLAQLLGICSIASCFRDEDRLYQEARIRTWIETVRQWLFKSDPRAQLTLGFMQAHLLMLVAGDVHWMKIDRSWISSGSLIRNAISAGLHREPRDFFRISPFHAELRRKLWYSILEYDLLTSFAKGRVPAVREDEYDCELPANSFDELISETSSEDAIRQPQQGGPGPYNTGGPVKLQTNVIVAKFLPLRSRVCRAVNSIKLDIDYDEVLHLDAELKDFLRQTSPADSHEAGSFKQTLSTILSQRAIIALHAPFVTRALNDPKWIYSRTRCLETAHSILSQALSIFGNGSNGDDCGPFATITNICRCEISNSVFLICHELLAQAAEQRGLAENSPLVSGLSSQAPGRWELRDKERLVDLVEKTSSALDRVSKSDHVSQRTCAWVRLSAELCRATILNTESTITGMKEAIRRGIHAWKNSRHVQATEFPVIVESELISRQPANMMIPTTFEGALDEDYFNLFFDMNTLGGFE